MVRSVHASRLTSWAFGVALRAGEGSAGLDFIFILGVDEDAPSALIPSCEKGFEADAGCAAGVDGFGVGCDAELLGAGVADEAAEGAGDELAGDGPPSFASRLARI
jgi:hypothetical protein